MSVAFRARNARGTHDTADTVLLAKGVEQGEQLERLGSRLGGSDDLDGDTLVKVDGDVEGGVGGLEGADGAGPTRGHQQASPHHP